MQHIVGTESRIWRILPSFRRRSSDDSSPRSRSVVGKACMSSGLKEDIGMTPSCDHTNEAFPTSQQASVQVVGMEHADGVYNSSSFAEVPVFHRRFTIGTSPTSWHSCVVAIIVYETGRLNRFNGTATRCHRPSRSSISRGGQAPRLACRCREARCGSWVQLRAAVSIVIGEGGVVDSEGPAEL